MTLLLGASLVVATHAGSQVAPHGDEFLVNTFTTDYQSGSVVSFGSDGSFVVVWESADTPGTDSYWGVEARRFDAHGVPLGDEVQVNDIVAGRQVAPDIATDAQGRFVVVWESSTAFVHVLRARIFDAAMAPLGDEFQINNNGPNLVRRPAVATDSQGGFVVVWQSDGSTGTDSSQLSIQARRFDVDAAPLGDQFRVNVYTTGSQRNPDVAIDSEGGFVVVWQSAGSYGTDSDLESIQARRFDSGGNPVGGELQVNSYTTNFQWSPAIASSAQGNFVVVWESYGSNYGDSDARSVQGQRFDPAFAPLGTQFQTNTFTGGPQWSPAVATGAGGDFLVTWASLGAIRAQHYSAEGDPRAGELSVSGTSFGYKGFPAMAADAPGNFVVSWGNWLGTYPYVDTDVYAGRFDALFRDGFESGDASRWSLLFP